MIQKVLYEFSKEKTYLTQEETLFNEKQEIRGIPPFQLKAEKRFKKWKFFF